MSNIHSVYVIYILPKIGKDNSGGYKHALCDASTRTRHTHRSGDIRVQPRTATMAIRHNSEKCTHIVAIPTAESQQLAFNK